ncbi:uncharacterized protein LOC115215721 [Octopus sinensis]|uniref:Uncharacterized protein LOC115215721 n=1 Tax=Octopus sinensis TaxID=2607531 RepID=A0A6P7SRE6_9MOLL|nr:uncharacterized protein LOC115215721 [Octopus sinensis]XP_036359744.1 uncharacterized protein LOC115215721 [Octopus sinensis]
MESSFYLEGDWNREKRKLTNERLKIARDNIYENALNVAEKEIDRQLQVRLQTITRQAMHLRQKIKEFTLEKKQVQLELKRRYFPDIDFRNDEFRLKTSLSHLGLYLNDFYLEKNQRYPIRMAFNHSTRLTERLNAKPSEYRKVPTKNGCPNVANNLICKKPKMKSLNNSEIGAKNGKTNFDFLPQENSCFDQHKSLPELRVSNIKEHKSSVLSESYSENLKDGAETKLPKLQNEEIDESEQNDGIEPESLQTPDLPNIGREILLGKPCNKCTDEYNNNRTGFRDSKRQFTELLKINQIQNHNLQSKTNGINAKVRHFINKCDKMSEINRDSTTETHKETAKTPENVLPQNANFIIKNEYWKLPRPCKKESISMDKMVLMMQTGFQGDRNQNFSVPLNTAKRALRHTPSAAKMQTFIKRLVSQSSSVLQKKETGISAGFTESH